MKIARNLLPVALVGLLLLLAGRSRSRAQDTRPAAEPPAAEAGVRFVQPGSNTPAYTVQGLRYGPTDQRDVEADWKVQSLLKKLGEAKDEAAKTDVQKQLVEVLGKQFDVRQETRERELKELEERVKRLREVLDKRQKAKDAIVRNHLEQLLHDAEGLGWGDASQDFKAFPVGGGFVVPARK